MGTQVSPAPQFCSGADADELTMQRLPSAPGTVRALMVAGTLQAAGGRVS